MSALQDAQAPTGAAREGAWARRLGLGVGAAACATWAWSVRDQLAALPAVSPGALASALAWVTAVSGLQVVRTGLVFHELGPRGVAQPTLTGVAFATVYATAGNAVEAVWLHHRAGLPLPQTVGRLAYRSLGTAGGAVLLVGLVTGGLPLAIGLGSVALLVGVGLLGLPAWQGLPVLPALGPRTTGLHLLALAAQLIAGASALAATMSAVGGRPTWQAACLGGGAVDLLAYLPIPLATLGVHQAGVTWAVDGATGAWAGLVHHATVLLHAVLLLLALALLPTREPAP